MTQNRTLCGEFFFGYDHAVWRRLADRRRQRQAQALNRAISALPVTTRRAMLSAANSEELIVGAYTDRAGRVCPMLAAHRRGARTCVGGFPRAWDAFARASRPRPASERELQILKALLEESLAEPEPSERRADRRVPAAPTIRL